ncbi:MAG: hypothetical protein IT437_07465 [Phycisphaerales bacterium]|nr:hypothetical protein [Phycisphaerales bacterium]
MQRLFVALDELDLDPPWDYRTEVHYDRSDLESCEYVHLHVNRAARGDTGPSFGTDYDLSTGCPECGTGARQSSPLRISRGSLPKKARAMRTHHGEVLIDHELATDMMIELRSERGLRQVEDRRLLTPLPWWQVLPEVSMPPAEASTGFTVDPDRCPKCRRAGFGPARDWRPLEFTYRLGAAERRALPDFVSTWEHFGESRIRYRPGYVLGFALPDILVSNRVMRLCWKAKIKGLQFVPVRFIG